MELFTKSVILTNRYIRYAGDYYCTIALVQTYEGQTMLYFKGDEPILKHVTTDPNYSDWLFKNHFDLLTIAYEHEHIAKHDWYCGIYLSDACKLTEFKSILQSINKIR
tara:strand:+ start:1166 stop:1489 length:324 start_codon:yes stop_codon:yes gene_type:complete